MVEAATLDRHSVGTDVDPLAVMDSSAKTGLMDVEGMNAAALAFAGWAEARRAEDEAAGVRSIAMSVYRSMSKRRVSLVPGFQIF
jgi:hypothetical protein